MAVGIICFWDRYATPYVTKYEEILTANGISYDVILWERNAERTNQFKDTDIVIHLPVSEKKTEKLLAMMLWKKQVLDIIKKKKYSKLIILSTSPGILLEHYLMKHFKGNYIFDIRDYTYELFKLYFKIEKKVINNSAFTTISSKGFESWLPKHEYIINHNITHSGISNCHAKDLQRIRPLNFSFIGNLRLYEGTYNLLLALKDTEWIHQTFVGREICGKHLEKIKTEHQITNLTIEGPFEHEKKPSVYENVHFVNSAYGSTDKIVKIVVDTAISNKLYDAATFRCPIVATTGTYLAEQIACYGLGFSIDYDARNAQQAFEDYLGQYDPSIFEKNCIKFLADVEEDEKKFAKKVADFCNN